MGGRLVQPPLDEIAPGPHQRQLGVILAGREGPRQRQHRLRLPVERQAEGMVGQQPGRVRPVARRLGVPDRVDHPALPDEPSGRAPVQRRDLGRQRPAQLQPEQITEQVVVAEPGPLGVERQDERVRVGQREQDPLRARPAGEQVCQLAVDLIEQGGAQQQVLDVGRLAFEHLRDQVLGDRPVAAGEFGHEALRVGLAGQGDRRQPQAGGPPLGPLVQQRDPGFGQRDPRGVEQQAGLALGEAQIGRADLGQLARQPQLVQAQPQIMAGGQQRVGARRKVCQQPGQLGDRLRRIQLVQIVDDQRDAAPIVGQFR